MSRYKNVSSRYRNGTRVQTKDEYLYNTDYVNPGHENKKDLYRTGYVLDSNKNDELALVVLTTHNGKSPRGTTSKYINVFDRYGNPIKIDNARFKASNKHSLSNSVVNY